MAFLNAQYPFDREKQIRGKARQPDTEAEADADAALQRFENRYIHHSQIGIKIVKCICFILYIRFCSVECMRAQEHTNARIARLHIVSVVALCVLKTIKRARDRQSGGIYILDYSIRNVGKTLKHTHTRA